MEVFLMKVRNGIVLGCVLGLALPALAQGETGTPVTTVISAVAIPVAPVTAPKAKLQPTGLAEIVRAKYPLAVTYQQLGAGWRELHWQGSLYYTKGDSHWLSEREYLIAYKFAPRDEKLLNEKEFIAAVTNNGYVFAPDDRFELTLLPSEEVIPYLTRGQTNLRSFDPSRYRAPFDASKGNNAFQQNLSLIYLRKIYQAFTAYERAYLDVTPPLDSAFAARQALLPFAENDAIFTRPGSDQPFKANAILGNKKTAHLRGNRRWVLFYEGEPWPDGMRAVLLFNGTVKRVDEKTWKALAELSKLD
jgi:hypothetical protein